MLLLKGKLFCFENNLIASLNGCIIPINPFLLGPNRNWDSPSTLRSNKVTNATLIRTQITTIT